ncbi:hypothetical protein B0O80DRAFT_479647 [Mortierella sp. GBAus27b]|nr:hypothetical protein BGX31_007540 [Mortierella sp. GBA43]KAI8363624.1 hypothetical protein B0O80DRAFT_479647 [Mortierella sp. GBAus27b]
MYHTSPFFSRATALAIVALGLLGSVHAEGTAETYNGTLCKDYVNYQVWMAPNLTVAAVEAGLVQQGLTPDALKLAGSCQDPLLQYACSTAFPRIEPTSTPNSFKVLFTCKSTCEAMVSACGQLLSSIGKSSMVPQCDGLIPGTAQTVPPGVAFQPAGSCNVVKNANGGSSGNGSSGNSTRCIPPLIVDEMLGPDGTTTNTQYCMGGCCLPCPAQYSLYKDGALETGFRVTNTMRAISMVFSFLLMASYIFLPDKKSHPSALILFFSTCVFLFSAVVIFPLVDTRAMQCVDAVNPSTQQNNLKCAIQGGILIFASVATCAWCAALILNLHLHTVWNSAWFAKKYWLLHILCWGFATAVAAVALGMGEVKWEYATLCLISQDKASQFFFYPLAAMIFPAFLVHVATFIHIARITAQAGIDSDSISRSTLSAGAAAVITHRRHVMMAIKIQWRAAVMAIFAILSVMFYWLFYFLQLSKINPQKLLPHVVTFVGCLASNPHDVCADQLAPFLPPYGLMIAAEFLVSMIGTMNFVVFFRLSLIHEWVEWFGSVRYICGGKRRQKEQEQFFVI